MGINEATLSIPRKCNWGRLVFHTGWLSNSTKSQRIIAWVAVVSVSFKPSEARTIGARGHWAKRSKKVGAVEVSGFHLL